MEIENATCSSTNLKKKKSNTHIHLHHFLSVQSISFYYGYWEDGEKITGFVVFISEYKRAIGMVICIRRFSINGCGAASARNCIKHLKDA
ncbi:hypothetical protein T07_11753 [Trichinella nelsoni]|uniref:Uncharacterized protein n=1 Tax=Trichinella nelsoni TaxID=6336 RepID=A0A0V0SEJ1_9BILA|nr:hypothetical protein T07_11753 [Trichinella nelsoni]